MDKEKYCDVVKSKLNDDQQLQRLLTNQFDRIDKEGRGVVNERQVKNALHMILKKQI